MTKIMYATISINKSCENLTEIGSQKDSLKILDKKGFNIVHHI